MSKARRPVRTAGKSKIGQKKVRRRANKRARPASKIKVGSKRVINKLKLSGALEWLLPMMETAYTPLVPRGSTLPAGRPMQMSSMRQQSAAMLAPAVPTVWRDLLLQYKQRKAAAVASARVAPAAAPSVPFVPSARDWLPLGPRVVLNGQTVGSQPVGGRVAGLAIAPGGAVVYAASANGGVFRSRDGGTINRSRNIPTLLS